LSKRIAITVIPATPGWGAIDSIGGEDGIAVGLWGQDWATPEMVGDLLRVFDTARDSQTTTCSWSFNRDAKLTAATLRKNLINFEVRRRCCPFPTDGQDHYSMHDMEVALQARKCPRAARNGDRKEAKRPAN
jgi:hypothetical protein